MEEEEYGMGRGGGGGGRAQCWRRHGGAVTERFEEENARDDGVGAGVIW
jgi:hypothetical protein